MQTEISDVARTAVRIDVFIGENEYVTIRDGYRMAYTGGSGGTVVYVFAGAPDENPHGVFELEPLPSGPSVTVARTELCNQIERGEWELPDLE